MKRFFGISVIIAGASVAGIGSSARGQTEGSMQSASAESLRPTDLFGDLPTIVADDVTVLTG